MSFILDALRRAETQRGHQPPVSTANSTLGEIAEKPSSIPSLQWIGLIAIAGIAVVAAIQFLDGNARPKAGSTAGQGVTANQRPAPVFPTINADTPLADVMTPATREVRPLVAEARPPARTVRAPATVVESNTAVTPGTVSYSQERLTADDSSTRNLTNLPDNEEALPSYADVALSGRTQLPQFHLDIHVYAAAPDRRFVFVNKRKYREGDQLDEGGTVERITPHGVVLNHGGRRFQLVPD